MQKVVLNVEKTTFAVMDKLRFYSLGSGSSGNCYYIGNAVQGLLIDAGVGPRLLRRDLKLAGIDLSQILGIFVTHDHYDHIKSVGTLGEKFNIPVYATAGTHQGIDRNYGMTQKLLTSRKFIENGEILTLGDFQIVSFPVSHDGNDNNGYFIRYKQHGILVATDLGYVNEPVKRYLSESTVAVLEANYDPDLLETGRYPAYLKQRILSKTGHLSNQEAGAFLAEHWHEKLSHVFLCHLSSDNNRPDIALKTVESYLEKKGIRNGEHVHVEPLKRGKSEMVIFEE